MFFLSITIVLLHFALTAANQTVLSGPSLDSYTIDMNSREIVLVFSEPIDPNSIDITGITISGMRGATDPNLYHQLSSTSVFNVDSPNMVRITLSDADFDALQSRLGVATMQSNTLLSMERRTVTDRSNRHIMAQQISSTIALLPQVYMRDTTPPEVTSFTLDLDSNRMALTFNEPVTVSSLFTYSLQISSHRDPTSDGISYNLTYNEPGRAALRAISFNLSLADTTFLEMTPGIATNIGNTFLSAPAGIVLDTTGRQSSSLSHFEAYAVIEDTSPPSVALFGLDLNTGTLDIHFDDPINATTFNPSSVTLQSAQAQRPMQWYTLSQESSSSYPDNTTFQVIRVLLTDSDLNQIKRIRSLCIDQHSCYMTVTASIARDINGIYSNAIANGRGLLAASFTGDQVPPELVSWVLDMDRGRIIVTFSETVDITSLQSSLVTLQSSSTPFVEPYVPFAEFDELLPADASSMFDIQLTSNSITRIKRTIAVGTHVQDSYLHMSRGAIVDMNSNSLLDTHLQASDVIPDTTPPSLVQFSLDVYTGAIRLSFDEVINSSSFNPLGLTLTNRVPAPSESYTLTGGSVTYYNYIPTFIQLVLNETDLTAINSNPSLANSRATSYIVAAAQTIQDMSQNQLNPILENSALQVLYYVDSPIEIYFQYSRYFVSEGQTAQLILALDTPPVSAVTFTVATEDRQAIGKSNSLDSVPQELK